MIAIIGFSATVIGATITVIGNLVPPFPLTYSTEQTCRQYEEQGSIAPGSCSCAEKIYDTWDESYDWMDACAILESREKNP